MNPTKQNVKNLAKQNVNHLTNFYHIKSPGGAAVENITTTGYVLSLYYHVKLKKK